VLGESARRLHHGDRARRRHLIFPGPTTRSFRTWLGLPTGRTWKLNVAKYQYGDRRQPPLLLAYTFKLTGS